jgi:phage N-6-adenine-methyltransferase
MSAALDMFPETIPEPDESSDERYTPSSLFLPLHWEFGFTLDVCATAGSAKCRTYFDKRTDGLKQSWAGERVWCNPPFSNIEAWLEKAWDYNPGALIVMLLPSWTDRPWWRRYVEPYRDRASIPGVTRPLMTTRFLPGRIHFGHPGNPEGVGVGSPMFGCVLLIWGAT